MVSQCAAALAALLVLNTAGQAGPVPVPVSQSAAAPAMEESSPELRRALRDGDEIGVMDEATPAQLEAIFHPEVPDATFQPAAAGGLRAVVSIRHQTMTVYGAGPKPIEWPVSTARTGHVTPTGRFRISADRRFINYHSRQYHNSPMPFTQWFAPGGYAVHGTDHPHELGRAASAGCVRLSIKNAAKLFEWSEGAGGATLIIQ